MTDSTRRDVLKATAALSAGGALVSSVQAEEVGAP